MWALSPLFAHTSCPPTGAVGHSWAQSLMFTPVSPTTTPATPPCEEGEGIIAPKTPPGAVPGSGRAAGAPVSSARGWMSSETSA